MSSKSVSNIKFAQNTIDRMKRAREEKQELEQLKNSGKHWHDKSIKRSRSPQ